MSQKSSKLELDSTDLTILRLLQDDGTLTNTQLAEHLSLSVTPCWRRLKRLQDEGYITGYQANLNRRKLGLDVLAFVQLRFMVVTDASVKQFEDIIRVHPAVLSCHKVTGEADYMLQVVAADLDAYSDFVEGLLRQVPGISMMHSSLAMREIKAVSRFPVGQADTLLSQFKAVEANGSLAQRVREVVAHNRSKAGGPSGEK